MPALKPEPPKATETISVRVPPDLARRLKKTCALRKADQAKPFRIQDVAIAAFEGWLAKNESP